ncbi:MAG TPA: DedA family protein [Pseudonocardiaceae bacterium]|nr:DedA family protein [Pseudonocardiaceae bacterium]
MRGYLMHPIVMAAATSHQLDGLAGFAASLMDTLGRLLGGPGAAIANGLDNVLLFLPSEVILPLAGVSVSQGHMTLLAAIVWTTIGSMVGATIMYYLGRWLGRHRARAILGRIPLVSVADVDRAEAWFTKHGTKAVLFGRMLPFFRGIISIPAGVERMNYALFLLYTTAGSLVWNTIFVLLGDELGHRWYVVLRYAGPITWVVTAVVVLAIGYFVVSRLLRRRREARAEVPAPTGEVVEAVEAKAGIEPA